MEVIVEMKYISCPKIGTLIKNFLMVYYILKNYH